MRSKALKRAAVGLLAFGTLSTSILAAPKEHTAVEANYKIVIDGETQRTSVKPVTINGTTYLPLRELAQNMLGFEVTFDAEKNTISLTSPQEQKPDLPTSSHLNPFALGSTVLGEIPEKRDREAIPYTLKLDNVVRGRDAYNMLVDQYIEAKDAEKDKARGAVDRLLPNDNYEFLIVSVDHKIGSSDVSEDIVTTAMKDFTAVCGSDITVDNLDKQYVEYKSINPTLDVDTTYTGKKIYPEGSAQGWLVFVVYEDDERPMVRYKDGQWIKLY